MKHLSLVFFALVLSFTPAVALDFYRAGKSAGELTVSYVAPTDSSTILLCKWTAPADGGKAPSLKTVGRKARIVTDDADYHLLSTTHMPVWDEAEPKYAYLKNGADSVNFILEFEKFPIDAPFDLVDITFEGSMFNVRGVTADASATGGVSAESYLGMTPYCEYGYFIEQGFKVQYYDDELCRIEFCPGEIFKDGGMKYQSLLMCLTNKSGVAVSFGPAGVSVTGWKDSSMTKAGKGIEILSAEKTDKIWYEIDKSMLLQQKDVTGGQVVGGSLQSASFSPGMPALAGLALFAVGAVLNNVASPDVSSEMKEMNEEREKGMQSYLKDCAVQPGQELETFVTLKHDGKHACVTTELKIANKEYIFNW